MKFEDAHDLLKGIPFISDENAKALYDFIIKNKVTNALELGFAHGVGSCYMAAALDELGGGKLVSVDLSGQDWQTPSIEDLLGRMGLEKYVDIHREMNGYTWYLHEKIEQNTPEGGICQPEFDFCIIDGPKNWTVDSCAFFLADKLMKQNSWIVFDDYHWTYESLAKNGVEVMDGIAVRKMSEKEIVTPQIKELFHLLVMQHPSYANFIIQDDWAWAQKVQSDNKKVQFVHAYQDTYRDVVSRAYHKLRRTLKR